MKDVQQKVMTAGETKTFEMALKRSQFLVKNFTGGNINVRLGNNDTHSVIAAQSFEIVFNNIDNIRGRGLWLPPAPLETKRFTVLDTYSPAVFRAQ